MKLNINFWILIGSIFALTTFAACDDDEDLSGTPIVIDAIYLQDAQSNVPDREVEFIRLGQVMRIEGSGFAGMRRVFINGYNTYFNPVYVSDNSMLVQISRDTPTIDAEDDVRNIVHLKKNGVELVYSYDIRAAAPSITSISHTLPQAGEPITVYGSGLVEINRVVFPGNIEVTEGIESDEDGEFVILTVPEGITEWGSVFVEGSNGGAYSAANFNFKEGIILDFDGRGQHGYWGSANSMITDEDLESDVIGEGNISQGTYVAHRPSRIDQFGQGQVRLSEVWTAGNDVDDWRGQLTPFIPASTPVNQVGFQFDIYVPHAWSNTGYLKILLYNSYNGGEWAGNVFNYVPWIEDKEVVPFYTEGWQTVTIPFSDFYGFADPEGEFTFDDVITARTSSDWKNFGIFFENNDFNLSDVTGNDSDDQIFEASPTSVEVYTDNWRVVSLYKPEYSDFPDDEDSITEE